MIPAIISWFVIGFISMIFMHLWDMRGEEYDEDYFDETCIFISFVVILLGYISLIFMIFASIYIKLKGKKLITKLLYKIANIGVKKADS